MNRIRLVVRCTTQEEWDFISKAINSKLGNKWPMYKENTGFDFHNDMYDSCNWYQYLKTQFGVSFYTFDEWYNLYGKKFTKHRLWNLKIAHHEY